MVATTGAACVETAGHLTGDGVVVLANLVHSPRVWEVMLEAYLAAGLLEQGLVDRLLPPEA